MCLEICTTIKEFLSDSILVPDKNSNIFGIGVGISRKCDYVKHTVTGVNYYVRIYTDSEPSDQNIKEIREILSIFNPSIRI